MHFVSVSNRIPRAGCLWEVFFFRSSFLKQKNVSFHKANDVRVLGKEGGNSRRKSFLLGYGLMVQKSG